MSASHRAQRVTACGRPRSIACCTEVRQLQAEGRTLVSLMRGQPDTPTPPHIVEAANQALRDGRTGYPDNQGEPILRQAVAEKLRARQRPDLRPGPRDPDHRRRHLRHLSPPWPCCVEPGDDVLLPDPIYDAYASPIALWGGRPVAVPSDDPRRPVRRRPRRARSRRARRDARVLLLNTPWNPIGTVLTRDELRTVHGLRRSARPVRHQRRDLRDAGLRRPAARLAGVAVATTRRQRTVLVNSLSKTYAMTGWRVGYCAGPAEIIRAMLLVLQQFSRGPATFVQDAAACALRGGPGVRPADGGGVSGAARPGRRAAARHPRRRAAGARGRAVRHGRCAAAWAGRRTRCGGSCCARRASSSSTGRPTGRAARARCASRSRPAARRWSGGWNGCATGCCDWRTERPRKERP